MHSFPVHLTACGRDPIIRERVLFKRRKRGEFHGEESVSGVLSSDIQTPDPHCHSEYAQCGGKLCGCADAELCGPICHFRGVTGFQLCRCSVQYQLRPGYGCDHADGPVLRQRRSAGDPCCGGHCPAAGIGIFPGFRRRCFADSTMDDAAVYQRWGAYRAGLSVSADREPCLYLLGDHGNLHGRAAEYGPGHHLHGA